MKLFLAALAFAALLPPSVFAKTPRTGGQPASAISLRHSGPFRSGYENLYLHTAPTPNPQSMQQELCDTAHDFCADFHGDNG